MLSIVIPAFNERSTIADCLAAVAAALPEVKKQIIIVDDYSSDGTRDFLEETFPNRGMKLRSDELAQCSGKSGNLQIVETGNSEPAELIIDVLYHDANRGKGAAVRTGFSAATGDVVVIQDADLEYDPNDWEQMYALIAHRNVADVVYGSRFYGRPHRSLYFHHYMANRLISVIFNLLYNQTLTDIEVCYKMMSRQALQSLSLTADDFGIEVQISAQLARARQWRIYEVGIHYFGRTYSEGKKINWKDGVKALWYLVKYRVV